MWVCLCVWVRVVCKPVCYFLQKLILSESVPSEYDIYVVHF